MTLKLRKWKRCARMTGMVVRLMNEDKKNVPIWRDLTTGSGVGISLGTSLGTAFGNMMIGIAVGGIFVLALA